MIDGAQNDVVPVASGHLYTNGRSKNVRFLRSQYVYERFT